VVSRAHRRHISTSTVAHSSQQIARRVACLCAAGLTAAGQWSFSASDDLRLMWSACSTEPLTTDWPVVHSTVTADGKHAWHVKRMTGLSLTPRPAAFQWAPRTDHTTALKLTPQAPCCTGHYAVANTRRAIHNPSFCDEICSRSFQPCRSAATMTSRGHLTSTFSSLKRPRDGQQRVEVDQFWQPKLISQPVSKNDCQVLPISSKIMLSSD